VVHNDDALSIAKRMQQHRQSEALEVMNIVNQDQWGGLCMKFWMVVVSMIMIGLMFITAWGKTNMEADKNSCMFMLVMYVFVTIGFLILMKTCMSILP
jgi:hypothetical protein